MTRHGTLAYYLAAWVCGCFFMSSAIFLRFMLDPHLGVPLSLRGAISNFWLFTFVGLIFGIGISLAGSFLMRRLMNAFRVRSTGAWVFSGAILAPIVVLAFEATQAARSNRPHRKSRQRTNMHSQTPAA